MVPQATNILGVSGLTIEDATWRKQAIDSGYDQQSNRDGGQTRESKDNTYAEVRFNAFVLFTASREDRVGLSERGRFSTRPVDESEKG